MKATYACVNGVQGTAKIDHFSPQGRVRGEVYLFAVNPDRVRFDVVSPFGADALHADRRTASDFEMLDVKEKQFLHGPASPCNLARLTQVPVPGHALVLAPARRGARARAPAARRRRIAWDGDELLPRPRPEHARRDARRSTSRSAPRTSDKPWNEQRVRVTDVRVTQRGVDLYHAELGNHEPARDAPSRASIPTASTSPSRRAAAPATPSCRARSACACPTPRRT